MPNPDLISLSYLLIPLIFVGWVYGKWTGSKLELPYATVRMLVQLIAVGYALIFIFSNQQLWLGTVILLFMLMVSAAIIFRNTQDKSRTNFSLIFVAILLASIINLGLILVVVLKLNPVYQPRYVIPLAGMVLSAAMNGISLAIERFEDERRRGQDFKTAQQIACKISMIPQINALLAVGVVVLPGMMTGQIISGIEPLVAVRYQIMIMIMSVSAAGMSIIFYFFLKDKAPQ